METALLREATPNEKLYLGFVTPCIFIHSNELIPNTCSN